MPVQGAVVRLRRGRVRLRRGQLALLARIAPSGRSLLVGFGLVALAAGFYAVARESSMFAIRTVEISGADARTAAAVRRAVAPLSGTSLLSVGRGDVIRRVEAVPAVLSATYDRAFPHTLRIAVVEERPVAVLHRGQDLFLLSARGRVIRPLPPRAFLQLPRIWVATTADVTLGATLAGDPGAAVTALVPLQRIRLPARVSTAWASDGQLFLRLDDGLELRLGDARDLPLKLTIARRIIPSLTGGFLDLSVPDRPVAGADNSQVEG